MANTKNARAASVAVLCTVSLGSNSNQESPSNQHLFLKTLQFLFCDFRVRSCFTLFSLRVDMSCLEIKVGV